jgi:uncharacterized protein YprB with RNaseH-like and TPR domain
MSAPIEICLDIETDWDRNLTVVGFRSDTTGVVQLIGAEISRGRLKKELPKGGRLFTYNGHCFELPVIRYRLGLDLRSAFDSIDLRWVCQRYGLHGGQKLIEQKIGLSRDLLDMDGLEAIHLWQLLLSGDPQALNTLLKYNQEDLDGLIRIKKHLVIKGIL